MDNNDTIANAILLGLMLDALIYVFIRAWQAHKLNIVTSALTDKLYYSTVITLFIKSMVYTGRLVGVNSISFLTVSYLADIGVWIVFFTLGLMAHEAYKKNKKVV